MASVLATAGLFGKADLAVIKNFTNWTLLLAFISIGLEFPFKSFAGMGFKPFVVYAAATAFNIFSGLGLAFLLFGGLLGI